MYLKLVNESTLNHNLTKYTFMFSNRKHIFYVSYIAMGVKYYKIFLERAFFVKSVVAKLNKSFLPVDYIGQ